MKYFFLFIQLGLTLIIRASDNKAISKQLFNAYYDSVIYESKSDKTLEYAFKMLKIGTELKNDSLTALANFEICHAYRKLGNISTAQNYAFKAAKYYRAIEDEFSLSSTFNIIGTNYGEQGNYELAITYLKKASSIHLKINNLGYVGDDFTNIGEAFRLSKNYDSAYFYFNNAYKIFQEIKTDSLRIAYAQCNIGLIYMYQNLEAKADSLFNLSFNYLNSINDYYPECITNYEIALKAFNDRNIEKASIYALSALEMANKYGFRKELIDVLSLSSQISQEKGDYQKAFQYLTKHQAYKDSLINDKTVSQMAEMRAEFEISQNETEMTYIKKVNKARNKQLMITSIGILIITVLALFLLRLSRMRKQANLKLTEFNEELDQKNHVINMALIEKDMLMKEIHHRVKNNLQIISSIIGLQSVRIENPEIIEMFNEMQRRILAISSIHQMLYQSDSVSLINMKDYLEEVVESIHATLNAKELNVSYEVAIENIEASIDIAVTLGLVVNELITNAYKYAFKASRTNTYMVSLVKNEKNKINVTLNDNGPGMPNDFRLENSNSLGLRMVNLLIRQNKGDISYENKGGAFFKISIG